MVGLAASIGGVGCFLSKDEGVASSPDEVVSGGDGATALKSTLILDTGCAAVKVGPKHLLLAARCVADNPAFETGKVITFKSATERQSLTGPSGSDAGPKDAGKDSSSSSSSDAGPKDGGANEAGGASSTNRGVTIASVEIHSSYAAKCKENACDFGKIAASNAKDIAVVILENELETVPTVPVDLDTVGPADDLLVVSSGCTKFDGRPSATVKATETIAVPAKTVNHDGSPYKAEPQFATRLGAAYVVTPGPGWRPSEGKICKTDIGAPLLRANVAAVAGITSNFTTWEAENLTPVTVHHTRVDATSKVGVWLQNLGVETTRSCGEEGCEKRESDAGMPSIPQTDNNNGGGTTEPGDASLGDGGKPKTDAGNDDAGEPEEEETEPQPESEEQQLPPDPPEDDYGTSDEDYADAAVAKKKKKKKDDGGCSAAPGEIPTNGVVVVAGLALAAAVARRRRRD